MLDENRALFSQHDEKGGIGTYIALRQPESCFKDCGNDYADREKLIIQYFSDCHVDLIRMMGDGGGHILKPLYKLPQGMVRISGTGSSETVPRLLNH